MLLGILGVKSFTKMRFFALSELLNLVLFSLIIGCVVSKECTNTFPELSSHSFRYALLTSKNETWKNEVLSQSHYHLTPTDESYWDTLLPRRMMGQQDQISWLSLYRQIKYDKGVNQNGNFLKAVSLSDVRLDPNSMYGRAQQTNLEYLLILDVDRLVWSFRKTAGLDIPGEPYGGWEAANMEIRGHFVGHFLSASAHMWASTYNDTLKDKMFEVVSILSECQKRMGSGYLSAFPSEFFDKFEALETIWAPYYTIHKIMAGLLDQYLFAGNEEAFTMLKWMVDYHYDRVKNVVLKYSIQRQWSCLNEETGGMNDILYRLYSITGDQKHLLLAHLFDKPCFLGELAIQADDIAGFHSNTHIPVVIGAQMRYEVTGDSLYKEIGTFFMDIINSSHAYATGGTSVSEFWSDPKRLATTLQTENEESCTTYNMLKVSRNLFRWSKEMRYADYYERALINGVLSIQRGKEPGVMIYMLPLKPGGSKAIGYHGWGNPFNSFWCCYGTGIESFSKLGDSIYFEEEGKVPGLYIIQYIPSSFKWISGGFQLYLKVNPVVSWDNRFQVTVIIASGATAPSTLNLRIPTWTNTKAAKAFLNNQNLDLPAAGNFLSITKWWSRGDEISLELPISLQLEAIKDDRPEYASLHAILYGPYLLAGLSNDDWDIKAATNASLTDWISPIQADYNDYLISLSQESGNTSLSLVAYLDSVRLQNSPKPGTNDAVNATIRLILIEPDANFSSPGDAIGKSVMLEPYGLPGMLVAHQDIDEPLHVIPSSSDESSVFHLVPGLDGAKDTVSLESASHNGCYIVGGLKHKSDAESLTLSRKPKSSLPDFSEAASFKMDKGISEYHPISFVAKGANRNFLLVPLLSFRDEHYTVYFNI